MWVAVDNQGNKVSAYKANPALSYFCPYSRDSHEVILRVASEHGKAHFAHTPNSNCPSLINEDKLLLNMRKVVGTAFADYNLRAVDKEHLAIGTKFVIALEPSPISGDQWKKQTESYNTKGKAITWIWDIGLLGVLYFNELKAGDPVVLIDSMRICQWKSYTRLYVMDRRGEVRGVRLYKSKENPEVFLYQESTLIEFTKPALGSWSWKEGFDKPLSLLMWHLHYPQVVAGDMNLQRFDISQGTKSWIHVAEDNNEEPPPAF